jgi:hypothetical protein
MRFLPGILLVVMVAGCGPPPPPSGDAPNTEAAVSAKDLSPEMQARESARHKVFGKPGPPGGGAGPGPGP